MPTSSNVPQADFDVEIAKFHPRQLEAIRALDRPNGRYVLYGGAMGGGKSYLIRWYCVRFLMQVYARHRMRYVQAMLACEDYPSLKDRQVVKIEREFPAWMGKSYSDHKVYGRCFILNPKAGSGVICLRNLDDASKYASSEFALIAVDELTKNLISVFNDLRTRNRWTGLKDTECKFLAGTNPGSVGHGWVKNLWISRSFPKEFYPPVSPTDYRPLFQFVKSLADDNPSLDASYWSMLSTLPIALRKAFRDGDWNTFIGQMFQEWDEASHVMAPVPVPTSAPIYMTYDWGFGAPFSIGWWWVDNDGRIYRFHEKYGWTGESNQGVRLNDDAIARMIIEEERQAHIPTERIVRRLAGPDCFAKRPDFKGGGQGKSTYENFKAFGILLSPGDPNRKLKIRQFHNRLAVPTDDAGRPTGERPMVQVYRSCEQFIRTIPDLVVDTNDIEDVDTKGEDHIYDEACHIMMARPLTDRGTFDAQTAARKPKKVTVPYTRMLDLATIADLEREQIREEIEEQQRYEEMGYGNFG